MNTLLIITEILTLICLSKTYQSKHDYEDNQQKQDRCCCKVEVYRELLWFEQKKSQQCAAEKEKENTKINNLKTSLGGKRTGVKIRPPKRNARSKDQLRAIRDRLVGMLQKLTFNGNSTISNSTIRPALTTLITKLRSLFTEASKTRTPPPVTIQTSTTAKLTSTVVPVTTKSQSREETTASVQETTYPIKETTSFTSQTTTGTSNTGTLAKITSNTKSQPNQEETTSPTFKTTDTKFSNLKETKYIPTTSQPSASTESPSLPITEVTNGSKTTPDITDETTEDSGKTTSSKSSSTSSHVTSNSFKSTQNQPSPSVTKFQSSSRPTITTSVTKTKRFKRQGPSKPKNIDKVSLLNSRSNDPPMASRLIKREPGNTGVALKDEQKDSSTLCSTSEQEVLSTIDNLPTGTTMEVLSTVESMSEIDDSTVQACAECHYQINLPDGYYPKENRHVICPSTKTNCFGGMGVCCSNQVVTTIYKDSDDSTTQFSSENELFLKFNSGCSCQMEKDWASSIGDGN